MFFLERTSSLIIFAMFAPLLSPFLLPPYHLPVFFLHPTSSLSFFVIIAAACYTRQIREDSKLQCILISLDSVSVFINFPVIQGSKQEIKNLKGCIIGRRFCKHLEINPTHVTLSPWISFLISPSIRCKISFLYLGRSFSYGMEIPDSHVWFSWRMALILQRIL